MTLYNTMLCSEKLIKKEEIWYLFLDERLKILNQNRKNLIIELFD